MRQSMIDKIDYFRKILTLYVFGQELTPGQWCDLLEMTSTNMRTLKEQQPKKINLPSYFISELNSPI